MISTLILLVHIALIPLAYLAAFGLRFDFQIPPQEFAHFQTTVWYLLGIRLIVFWAGGLYRGYWKHVGLRDLVDLGLAVTISSAAFVAALSLLGLLRGMPRSVFLLDWVVMIFFSGGIRFAARALRESRLARARLDDGRRTIIIGAGEGGEQLLRQVLHDPRAGMNVVGFVDDKPETHGRTLHGVPVLGHTGRLKELAAKYDVELLVIAMRSVTGAQTRRIVDRCRETGVEFKIIPSIDDLLKKRATIDQLRDVAIEDLLGRAPVHLNLEQIKQDLAGKSILVTGGAGSIGSELARQIASYGPARLVLPAPGDVRGLPGPGAFSREATAAGEGVLFADIGLGVVPTPVADGVVRWSVYRVPEPGPAPQAPDANPQCQRSRQGRCRPDRALQFHASPLRRKKSWVDT